MRKNLKYKIIGLALLIVSILSCDTADQDVSPIVEPDDSYPVVTYTLENTGTITEGDTIVYTISLSTAITKSLSFYATVDEDLSTAEEHVDFDIIQATISPYETEAKLLIITYETIDTEDNVDETIVFQFGINSLAEKYLVHPSTVHAKPSVSLKNYVSDDLVLEFSWDVDIDLGFGVYPTSANVDFDIFISDAAGFDISNPWATFNSTIYAATGSHPEIITITPGLLPDGEYVFWFDFWANAFWGYGDTTDIPVSAFVSKAGYFNVIVDQDPSSVVNANMPGYAEDGTETNGTIVKVTIAGTTYTISDYSDVVVGTGKSILDRTPRPASIIKE